ncbi:unnamed protein product [Phytophthora fragariaefolia]|uniref:Unnamed protein product n=1 Tax=Phytophthora fragariaefolia TaxID=1490495 RepID=A0A9W6TRA8_9STRA|nr:unnamed protein product [Phytophthora fragariaefolia]
MTGGKHIQPNYYDVLGVDRWASTDDVKAAYYKLLPATTMSSEDVHEMFGGLNEYERFTTAQYHRQHSHIAPAAIGRRATNLAERKQFRAARVKLHTQSATMAWLAFPVVLVALWGFNLKSIRSQSRKQ